MNNVGKPKRRIDYQLYMQARRQGKYVVVYIEDSIPEIQYSPVNTIDEGHSVTVPVIEEFADYEIGISDRTEAIRANSEGETIPFSCCNDDSNPEFGPSDEIIHDTEILTITKSLFSAKVLSIANRAVSADNCRAGP